MRDGVSRYKGQWRADLVYLLRNTEVCRHVGMYPTEEMARAAYLQAREATPLLPPTQPTIRTSSDLGDFIPPGV